MKGLTSHNSDASIAGFLRSAVPAALCSLLLLTGSGCTTQRPDENSGSSGEHVVGKTSYSSADTRTIEGANGFKSYEIFRTSTEAPTGYDAYAAWDATHLYFGYTGQDVGAAACTPQTTSDSSDCPPYARGESSSKYLYYYLDVDPQGSNGTTQAMGSKQTSLPFSADYLVRIRTDYDSSGVAGLYAWTGQVWSDQGTAALEVADNDGSKFLEFSLARQVLGQPSMVKVVSWFADDATDRRYAYWPHDARPHETSSDSLAHYYGFVLRPGQTPNASNGKANKDRPFFEGYAGGRVNGNTSTGEAPGRSFPFHTIGFSTSNDFSGQELFTTSTEAATGYDAYASWDATNLYFGYTGADLGPGDCAPANRPSTDSLPAGCPSYEAGQSPDKWLVYYLDTDPQAKEYGTATVQQEGQTWQLPFRADYRVLLRTDGVTNDRGYTGVADVQAWNGKGWTSHGPGALEVFINSTSGFGKFALSRSHLGSPDYVQAASWIVDTARDTSYAFWPSRAVSSRAVSSRAVSADRATSPREEHTPQKLRHAYGFVLIDGQAPNTSDGQANLDRPFVAGLTPTPVNGNSPAGTHPGGAFPYHTIGFSTSNDFTHNETFQTNTQAATGYQAYASWDSTNVYFGYTGSDIGPGDCALPGSASPNERSADDGDDNDSDPDPQDTGTSRRDSLPLAPDTSARTVPVSADCGPYETGQSPNKRLIYYLDTDPQAGKHGTTDARAYGDQDWTLPFRADYAVVVRSDGETVGNNYTGVADLKKWTGSAWASQGPVEGLEIHDNSTSGFLKFSVAREALDDPDFLKVTSWFTDTEHGASYAYWPQNAAGDAATPEGTTTGAVELQHAYGFVLIDGQRPATSNGQANLDRPFVSDLKPQGVNGDAPRGQSASAPQPFHTVGFTTSNDFTGRETFRTSTQAATGYDAYASWDAKNLYLGYTGADIGPGDCQNPDGNDDCHSYETGQSPGKWLVYYLDTDPFTDHGTTQAQALGAQSWTLPFPADYAVRLRTDGETVEGQYTGVATLLRWNGERWKSLGPHALEIFDNSTSGFLKLSVSRESLGHPTALRATGWFADTDRDVSYAYWPRTTPADPSADGTTRGHAVLEDDYGFYLHDGQHPSASGGLANLNRPFFSQATCPARGFNVSEASHDGSSRPFHAIDINGSNGFTRQELFSTSTEAATGYDAYASWDRRTLYLGLTGSNVGGGDCEDAASNNCSRQETGQGPHRWLAYYLDTDPGGPHGTTDAYTSSDTLGTRQRWRLPFRADYVFLIRTDGQTLKDGHTGVVEVKKWNGTRWMSQGPCALDVWDNNGSGFVEISADLGRLGYPVNVKIAGWVFGEQQSYAYWPDDAASDGPAYGRRLSSWWGFPLRDDVKPNAAVHKNKSFQTSSDQVTPSTYTVNGRRDPHEQLPAESLGQENPGEPAGPANPELFLTWDEANLYLSLQGQALTDSASALYVAFDTDPSAAGDPRTGPGRTHLPATRHHEQAVAPFAADLVYRLRSTTGDSTARDSTKHDTTRASRQTTGRRFTPSGDSAWASTSLPKGIRVAPSQGGGPTEIALPWSTIDDRFAASKGTVELLVYLVDRQNGIEAQWPPQNPNGSAVSFNAFRSYRLQEEVAPASKASLSLRTEQGATLAEGQYANLYLTPSSAQTSTLGRNTTVLGELFVGPHATLDMGTNSSTPQGYNKLRIGRRLYVAGSLKTHQGEIVTYAPPLNGDSTRSTTRRVTTDLLCEVSFYTLTLRAPTALQDCPVPSQETRVYIRDTLQLVNGAALNTNGHAFIQQASPRSRATPSTATAPDKPARTGTHRGSDASFFSRIKSFFRRQKQQ